MHEIMARCLSIELWVGTSGIRKKIDATEACFIQPGGPDSFTFTKHFCNTTATAVVPERVLVAAITPLD